MMGQQQDRDLQRELSETRETLASLLDIGMSAHDAKDAEEQIYEVLQTLIDLTKADAAVILLREGKVLSAFLSLGAEEDAVERFTVPFGQGFAGKIAETKEHLYVHDAQTDPIVISPYVKRAGIHSMLGVPLLYGGEAIGVLHIDWLSSHLFSERELEVLKIGAERCASAIAIARMCEVNCDLSKQACMYLDIIEHDLNNLHRIMMDDLETVLSTPGLDRDIKDTIEAVKRDVRESETIVDNVRKLHLTLNEDLPVETMDLDDMIREAINELARPENKDVTIHYEPKTGRAITGIEMLKDVFFTLFNNAIYCSREDVTIDINVDKVRIDMQPYYMVTIADNSQLIPDDVKEELFTYHLGLTEAHGKALPLFLVRLIIDRMGGDIRVEDREPGDYKKGTEFVLTLPAIEGPVIPETEPNYP